MQRSLPFRQFRVSFRQQGNRIHSPQHITGILYVPDMVVEQDSYMKKYYFLSEEDCKYIRGFYRQYF